MTNAPKRHEVRTRNVPCEHHPHLRAFRKNNQRVHFAKSLVADEIHIIAEKLLSIIPRPE